MRKNESKLVPQATDVEEIVLGALLLDKDAILEIIDILSVDSFYKTEHKKVYEAILELNNNSEAIDLVTVPQQLIKKGELEMVGGAYAISKLTNKVSSAANIETHARILKQKEIARSLITLSNEILDSAYDETVDVLDITEHLLTEAYNIDTNDRGSSVETNTELLRQLRRDIETANTKQGITGLTTGIQKIDQLYGGYQKGHMIVKAGRPGCLSGDTVIYVSRKKDGSGRWYRLKDIYEKYNNLSIKNKWNLDLKSSINSFKYDINMTGLNEIEGVVYSGIKTTYLVETESGNKIRATLDHKFLTDKNNIFKRLKDLSAGDFVFIRKKAEKSVKKKDNRETIYKRMPYYPSARVKMVGKHKYHRITKCRAVYDSNLNGITLDDFLNEVTNNPLHTLVFSDLRMDIHHIDEDPTNDSIENLELLTKEDHREKHKKSNRIKLGLCNIYKDKIISITEYGEEPTYDIQMKAPYHNFIAEGIVVHNSGKSSHALCEASHMAIEQGKSVLFFSLEMTSLELMRRLIAINTEIPLTRMQEGNMSASDWDSYNTHASIIMDSKIKIIDTPGLSLNSIRRIAKKHAMRFGLDAIYIDYLQLITHYIKGGNREQEISIISRSLKALSKEINVPIVALAQLSRAVEQRGGAKKPILSDLRESGSIEQDADSVQFLYRPEYYGITEDEEGNDLNGKGFLLIAKNRHGATKDIDMRFIGTLTKFTDWSEQQSDFQEEPYDPNAGMENSQDFDSDSPF